jgi:hypothetical protein
MTWQSPESVGSGTMEASSPIDFHVAANAAELNRSNVRTIGINGGAVRWFDPDFSFVF